ncbi:GDSL-type esterase/lipase family protein [Planctomycetota bacterium]
MMPILIGLIFWGSILACAAEAEIKIMPLGDSITEGVIGSSDDTGYRRSLYLSLTAAGCNVNFVGGLTAGIPVDFDRDHEGHSGWRADQIRDNVYNWLSINPADIVMLHIGTNDITGGNEDVAEVNDILNEIDRYSQDITVILAARIILRNDTKNPETIAFNDAVEAMAAERIIMGDDIIIVDMENALTYPDDLADTLHPNNSGYNKMANVWYDALIDYFTPVITSTAVTSGIIGVLYVYDVNAVGYPDPNYTLIEHPPGMTIDTNTGLIEWIPASANDFNVTVEARNNIADTNQSFTITVPKTIEFDAVSSDFNGITGTQLSWPHTIGSGDNRFLIVGTLGKDKSDGNLIINTVTYNNVPMMPVENSAIMAGTGTGNDLRIKTELYYMLDKDLPPTGTYDVIVTYSANVKMRSAGVISLRNVDQEPAEAVDANSDQNSDTISTNITTLTDGAWLIDIVGTNNNDLIDVNQSNNQIERFDVNTIGIAAAGSTRIITSAGPAVMNWTFPTGAEWMVHSVAAFAPEQDKTISGHIYEPNGAAIEGVLISTIPDIFSGTADPNGCYEFIVPNAWSGTVAPTKAGCMFAPAQRIYNNVTTNHLLEDFDNILIYNLDGLNRIDFGDLKIMSDYWLQTGATLPCDFYDDGTDTVNFLDFVDFANAWRK